MTSSGPSKDPWLAVLLSKVFPGAGQIYAGARQRGALLASLTVGLLLTIYFSLYGFLAAESAQISRNWAVTALTAGAAIFVISIAVLFDAYRVTKRLTPLGAIPAAAGHRKPWFSAFLSAIIPGIGQLYSRQILKGLSLLIAAMLLAVLEDRFLPLIVLSLLVYLYAIKDAFDSAEAENGTSRRFLQQDKVVVWFIVIMSVYQAVPFSYFVKVNLVEAFKIPSGAMLPTLQIGDHILTRKFRTIGAPVQRGDIVVFPSPQDPTKNFIKRVIGVGGDAVRITGGELYINDQLVPSRDLGTARENTPVGAGRYGMPTLYEEMLGDVIYQVQYLNDRSTINAGPWHVPSDAVFVLGDNRDNSMDSRVFGMVPVNTVTAKARKIYWSWDGAAPGVRWKRIGETIH